MQPHPLVYESPTQDQQESGNAGHTVVHCTSNTVMQDSSHPLVLWISDCIFFYPLLPSAFVCAWIANPYIVWWTYIMVYIYTVYIHSGVKWSCFILDIPIQMLCLSNALATIPSPPATLSAHYPHRRWTGDKTPHQKHTTFSHEKDGQHAGAMLSREGWALLGC